MLDIRRRAAKCILHIGLEKTGTSTIQKFLSDNRDLLRREAVLYPRAGHADAGGSCWGFAALACSTPWEKDIGRFLGLRSQADVDAYRTAVTQELALEFSREDGVATMIVSSEHFHSRLCTRQDIARLKSFMAQWAESFQIVLYLRRQDRIALGLYSTHVRSGQTEPTPFLPRAGKALPYYYDYETAYLNWAAVFGASNMTLRIFDDAEFAGGSLLADFSAACGLSLAGKSLPSPVNASIDPAGTAFLLEANRQLRHTDPALAAQIGRSLSHLRKGKVFPFCRTEALHFYEQFRASNERLKQRVFKNRSAPLFDVSFNEYPETVEPAQRSYEDAVAVAVQLIDDILPRRSPKFTAYPNDVKSVRLIRQLRPDIRKKFPLAYEGEWREFLDWLVLSGCREYRLLAEDADFRSYLAAVEPGDCVDRLQRLVYTYRPDVRLKYPLPQKRDEFEDWFYTHGAAEFELRPLLSRAEENGLPHLKNGKGRGLDTAQQGPLLFDQRPDGVNLIGYAYGQLGIGEDVRMAGRACLANGIPFCIVDFPAGRNVSQGDFSMIDHVAEDGPYAFNIFCLTAPEHGRYVAQHGTEQLAGRFNIGYWPWELGRWPDEWEQVAAFVDEVWVSSWHTYRALAPVCPVTVRRMPMAVALGSVSNKDRSEFGLPRGPLLFCFAFDLNSTVYRKNPHACTDAFRRAFPLEGRRSRPGADVGLVIKANRSAQYHSEWEKLKQEADKDPRVHVIEDDLERPDLLALYQCCDCFLSLHRAEGFGRCIAEALQLGLHVITTGYSGNVDFCDRPEVDLVDYELVAVAPGQYPFSDGQVWAEPDADHAATLMREFAGRARRRPGREKPGRTWPEFSPQVVGKRYRERLQAIRKRHGNADS